MEQLRRQMELISNTFHYIYMHDGDLDLQLTVTVNSAPSTSANNQQMQQESKIQPAGAGAACKRTVVHVGHSAGGSAAGCKPAALGVVRDTRVGVFS